jgi:methionyl-tRNA formyltransferase
LPKRTLIRTLIGILTEAVRIVFAGTPEFAVPALDVLAAGELCAVVTAPDRPAGRRRTPQAPPVKRRAVERGVPVLQPARIGRAFSAQVAALHPDLLVAVAYGKIFRPYFLDVFSRGGVNVHPSLLPELRGPAPIPAAILAGKQCTGVSVQRLAAAVDAGDILAQRAVTLQRSETSASLAPRLARIGAELLREVVDAIAAGRETARPQEESAATWCGLLSKDQGRIDWRQPAAAIERAVRAYQPWPRAYTTWAGRQLTILAAALDQDGAASSGEPGEVVAVDRERGILVRAGHQGLWVRELQLQGKKPLPWQAFANGHPGIAGARLGE